MLTAFKAYVRKYGNGHIAANWEANQKLGRWVAMLRYQRKIGQLTPGTIADLDKLGFIWSPSDLSWNVAYKKLRLFHARFGHCNVPSVWPHDPQLASWVAHQRRRHNIGLLIRDRTQRLEKIGFIWKIYGCTKNERLAKSKKLVLPQVISTQDAAGERVYNIGSGGYVQYGGHGHMPVELRNYLARNGKEWPPCILLPKQPTIYVLSEEGVPRATKVEWKGQGPLPAQILDYLNENGSLPRSSLKRRLYCRD